jgi:hypothetical protein
MIPSYMSYRIGFCVTSGEGQDLNWRFYCVRLDVSAFGPVTGRKYKIQWQFGMVERLTARRKS